MSKRVALLCVLSGFSALVFPAVFAVLESGPEKHQGIPGFQKNRIECLYGTYTASGARPEIWLVSGFLPLSADWDVAVLPGGRRIFRHGEDGTFLTTVELRNQNEFMQQFLRWTILVFPDTLNVSDTAAFINLFVNRFEYFGSTVKTPSDISFPAVLETR